MKQIQCIFRFYTRQESGATAIEYGLIAAGISMAIAASVFAFGDSLNDLFFERLLGLFTF